MKTPVDTFAAAFAHSTRPDGSTYWHCNDDAPEWVRDIVHAAHDGAWPCDWRYDRLASLARDLAGAPDLEDFDVHEWADGAVDVYNGRLAQWLADTSGAADAVEMAQDEWGMDTKNVFEMLQMGQLHMLHAMGSGVVSALVDQMAETDA